MSWKSFSWVFYAILSAQKRDFLFDGHLNTPLYEKGIKETQTTSAHVTKSKPKTPETFYLAGPGLKYGFNPGLN